ncbi:plasmid partitioning protein RepB [Paracoccus sp. YIM 132242]|uniref:Plasmid partitioning protein RepB n=1 Tax=Paracoccus lichenicola TaxID=2665644 RepID=A0A6L6HRX6_9RHOB|nr:plasmid partitioning protein RepB [Paracoccus lichenicola]MTE01050.1 plasmid partitioning protein RepB [Paracoccus lichenicola]
MARKDLLKNLMAAPPGDEPRPPLPRSERGAIGAVSKSISELKNRAIIEVPADLIDHAGLDDRLDEDPQGIEALMASIKDYGQQVPVLLRHSPNAEGRYDVVFGRRRVAAMRRLGLPVKAMVRSLNDRELVVAQGQENSARKDLSFIEKANFARQMVAAGYERRLICDALSIDKTVISRMLSVIDALPDALIRAIGAAPSAGRDRWLALAQKAEGRKVEDLVPLAQGADSDARFAAVLAAVSAPPARPASRPLLAADGRTLGQVRRGRTKTVIELEAGDPAFADWLADHMAEVHRDWLKSRQ